MRTTGSSWVSYESLFLLGFAIVHFQIPFLASIGIEPENPNFIWINKDVVNYATWLSLLAILLWMFGYLFKLSRNLRNLNNDRIEDWDNKNFGINTKRLDLLLIISFLAFITLVGKEFLGGSYDGGDNWGAGAHYVFLLLRVTIYLKIIYFFKRNKNEIKGILYIVPVLIKKPIFFSIIVAYTFIFLLAGDRDPILSLSIVFASSYTLFVRKISFQAFFITLFVGAVFFSLVRLGRSRDASGDNILSRSVEAYGSEDVRFNPTDEFASSNRILYRALDVVPETHPYLFGITFASEIIGVIPFGGSTFQKEIGLPLMYSSSSYFFTILGQGELFTSGEGSEIIADIYVNFGIYGVFVLFFFLGYFISYLSYKGNVKRNHIFILIYIVFTMGALYINRSHFLDPLKTIFYILVIDFFFVRIKWERLFFLLRD